MVVGYPHGFSVEKKSCRRGKDPERGMSGPTSRRRVVVEDTIAHSLRNVGVPSRISEIRIFGIGFLDTKALEDPLDGSAIDSSLVLTNLK